MEPNFEEGIILDLLCALDYGTNSFVNCQLRGGWLSRRTKEKAHFSLPEPPHPYLKRD